MTTLYLGIWLQGRHTEQQGRQKGQTATVTTVTACHHSVPRPARMACHACTGLHKGCAGKGRLGQGYKACKGSKVWAEVHSELN